MMTSSLPQPLPINENEQWMKSAMLCLSMFDMLFYFTLRFFFSPVLWMGLHNNKTCNRKSVIIFRIMCYYYFRLIQSSMSFWSLLCYLLFRSSFFYVGALSPCDFFLYIYSAMYQCQGSQGLQFSYTKTIILYRCQ